MQLKKLHILNFRALADVEVPLSDFGCIIGENNAGKSSVLHALVLVLTGSAPRKTELADFHDRTQPIRVELTIEDIGERDLARVSDTGHRASLASDIVDGAITLVRIVNPEGVKQSLKVLRLAPADTRYSDEVLTPLMKGKKDGALRDAVVELIPALENKLGPKPTQAGIRLARDEIVASLPESEKILRDEPLGTGIDAAIKSFLPEAIYIEAVKDVANDMKTTDSALFGKLLKILLDEVSDQFHDLEDAFADIHRRLSRVADASGAVQDNRLPQVQRIETTIQDFVRESFPDIDLKMSVPVPELKTIFSAAELSVDDGHEGPIASKGDGLKRAVAFAILRAYTVLRSGINSGADSSPRASYILLFEEPELYLYPRAQRQLFRALELFSKDHPVLVTTHSPTFFSADATKTFIKLSKKPQEIDTPAPYTFAYPVDLRGQLSDRDAFQMICHENNDIAFFSRAVVLVEGDSDAIVLGHLAKLLNTEWDCLEENIAFARIGGKHNISRYKTFFGYFGIDVHVVCDLDALLDGHGHLFSDPATTAMHQALLAAVNKKLPPKQGESITQGQANQLSKRGDAHGSWLTAESQFRSWDGSADGFAAISSAMEDFFSKPRKNERLEILKGDDPEVIRLKNRLLATLRDSKIYVLGHGDLEDYYGSFSSKRKSEKVAKALDLCGEITDLARFRALHESEDESIVDELRNIMVRMFAGGSALDIELISRDRDLSSDQQEAPDPDPRLMSVS